jgi:hypothetical protein
VLALDHELKTATLTGGRTTEATFTPAEMKEEHERRLGVVAQGLKAKLDAFFECLGATSSLDHAPYTPEDLAFDIEGASLLLSTTEALIGLYLEPSEALTKVMKGPRERLGDIQRTLPQLYRCHADVLGISNDEYAPPSPARLTDASTLFSHGGIYSIYQVAGQTIVAFLNNGGDMVDSFETLQKEEKAAASRRNSSSASASSSSSSGSRPTLSHSAKRAGVEASDRKKSLLKQQQQQRRIPLSEITRDPFAAAATTDSEEDEDCVIIWDSKQEQQRRLLANLPLQRSERQKARDAIKQRELTPFETSTAVSREEALEEEEDDNRPYGARPQRRAAAEAKGKTRAALQD